MNNQLVSRLTMFFLITYAVGVSLYVMMNEFQSFEIFDIPSDSGLVMRRAKLQDVKSFLSDQDFKNYLAKANGVSQASGFGRGGGMAESSNGAVMQTKALAPMAGIAQDSSVSAPVADRISGTNVQVAGIDEPDIVKTDGTNIYASNENYYYPFFRGGGPVMMEKRSIMIDAVEGSAGESVVSSPSIGRIMPPQYQQNSTKVVKALPAKDLAQIGTIEKNGNMLISGKNMVMFTPGQEITGYDISNPDKIAEKWNMKFQNNTEQAGARLMDGKIYLVVKNIINAYKPCPIEPMIAGDKPVSITCDRIYHPVNPIQADITFSALIINPENGEVEKTVSFIGSSGNSVMYMSADAIYLSYSFPGDFVNFAYNFFNANNGMVPAGVVAKIRKLQEYDISYNSKSMELSAILEQYKSSLSDDDRLKFENEVNNKMKDYIESHKRDLEKTGIVKISTKNLKVESTGVVSGNLLNQFAMDEFDGNLRVATTIGQWGFWMFGFNGGNQSTNDVYVLDDSMNTIGSVKDLGKEERIYSVRFIEDKGYVVTFKQVDPFFVLDLSNPKKPEVKGELKIPGYSSYLHLIAKNIILGVGQESNQVKLSLFDVSDASDPKEVSKYSLDEYWTEVSNNHHAFLQDAKHNIFFIPGGKGGYIFSYENNSLSLKKAISGVQANRALYLNDILYIVGTDKVTALDEKTWEKAGEANLKN